MNRSSGDQGWMRFYRACARCVCVMAMVAIAGCVDQKKEVQIYRDVLDAGRPKPKPLEPGETLTLDRALALANADNEQVASQGETYLQTLIAKNRIVAQFLPTVSFQPNFTIEERPGANGSIAGSTTTGAVSAASGAFVNDGSTNTIHRFEAPVVGAFNFSPPAISNLKVADWAIEQQRQLLINAQAVVLLNVAQTYYQVLLSEQQVEVLRHSLDVQEARVRDVETRFANHLALALEVSQTRAQAAATRVSLSQALSDVRNGRRFLSQIIAVAAVDGPLLDETLVPDELAPMEEYVAQAVAHRQDLLAAQAALKASRYAVDAAIAEYYPSVTLNVAGFLYRENFTDASKWDAILIGYFPIFSAGIIEADVRTAWSRLRQAALAESFLHRQVEQDVQISYDNFVTAGKKLVDLNAQVRAASDALQQSIQLRDNGLAIPLDVLNAQDVLLNAQLQYSNEAYSRTVFYLDLIRVTGQLNPDTPASLRKSRVPASIAPIIIPSTHPSTMPAMPKQAKNNDMR